MAGGEGRANTSDGQRSRQPRKDEGAPPTSRGGHAGAEPPRAHAPTRLGLGPLLHQDRIAAKGRRGPRGLAPDSRSCFPGTSASGSLGGDAQHLASVESAFGRDRHAKRAARDNINNAAPLKSCRGKISHRWLVNLGISEALCGLRRSWRESTNQYKRLGGKGTPPPCSLMTRSAHRAPNGRPPSCALFWRAPAHEKEPIGGIMPMSSPTGAGVGCASAVGGHRRNVAAQPHSSRLVGRASRWPHFWGNRGACWPLISRVVPIPSARKTAQQRPSGACSIEESL